MRPCEYYERLISDSQEASPGEREQLEITQHLRQCASCREFAATMARHEHAIQSLPLMAAARPLPEARKSAPGFLSQLWNTRLTVPVPVAAAAILVLLSVAVFSLFSSEQPAPLEQPLAAGQVDYVQVEMISPSTAVRITPSDTE